MMRVLNSWRDRCCCFNGDMQGTAAVTFISTVSLCRLRCWQSAELLGRPLLLLLLPLLLLLQ
jgi:malic enzyme